MSFASIRRALPITLLLAAACGGGSSGAGGGSSSAGGAGGAITTSTASGGSGGSGTGGGGGAETATSSAGGSGGAGCMTGAMQACYTGPAGTMGLGACTAGMQACQPDGTFGPCLGEVLPTPESCATPIDDDCNGATNEGCVCMPGATASCYGGPTGTDGVGICKAGMQTCAADGLGFGLCMGQVQPQIENCLAAEDEDCSGAAQACTGAGVWAKRFGDAQAQVANAVANHQGGPVITGALSGGADFGGGVLTSAGNTDVFVASYDYTGAFMWAKRFGDAGAQTGVDVAVDDQGNTLVIGDFVGTVNFGGVVLTTAGNTDVFVLKLDSAGAVVWAKRFGDNQAQNGRGIAVDDQGNVVITGSFNSKIDFGSGNLMSAGLADVFVAKFDKDGNHKWSKRYGDATAQSGRAVAVDLAGNVIITGDATGVIDFGGVPLTTAGLTDVFVASLDKNGNHFWGKIFGNASAQTAGGITVDSVGNVIVTGNAAGVVDFGGGTLTSAGVADVYVAKFTQAGQHLWSKLFGSAGAENGRDVTVDRFGGITIVGDFVTTVNFGGAALTSAGGADIFVAKLDPLGAHVWSKRYGDVPAQSASSVAADDSGGILVTGSFLGAVDFAGGPLTTAGLNDVFVAKLSP